MVLLRQGTKRFLILSPVRLDVCHFVPFTKLLPHRIRATNFIKQSDTLNNLERFLVRIEFRHSLHNIELRICNTGLSIIRKTILNSSKQFAGRASRERLEPYCPERHTWNVIAVKFLFQFIRIKPAVGKHLERKSVSYTNIHKPIQFTADAGRDIVDRRFFERNIWRWKHPRKSFAT